jgi:hypothetical protein
MLQISTNNLMVARLNNGRTLSYYQKETPIQKTAEDGFMPGAVTHQQLLQFMRSISTDQKQQRFKAGVCIPDTSLAQALGVPVDHVRELLSDLAENRKVHRTSVSRDGTGSWCLGAGF